MIYIDKYVSTEYQIMKTFNAMPNLRTNCCLSLHFQKVDYRQEGSDHLWHQTPQGQSIAMPEYPRTYILDPLGQISVVIESK